MNLSNVKLINPFIILDINIQEYLHFDSALPISDYNVNVVILKFNQEEVFLNIIYFCLQI
jgi:hypothetical protein